MTPHELEVLLEIAGIPIWVGDDGAYIAFLSDLDICNDGCGPAHGDKHHIAKTAYRKGGYLNADKDCYIVTPPQIISAVPGVVLGCLGRLTHSISGVWYPAVVGEIGPDDKTGEASYCLAKKVNTEVTHNSGDKRLHYLYEMWPGLPAVVDEKEYALQAS